MGRDKLGKKLRSIKKCKPSHNISPKAIRRLPIYRRVVARPNSMIKIMSSATNQSARVYMEYYILQQRVAPLDSLTIQVNKMVDDGCSKVENSIAC